MVLFIYSSSNFVNQVWALSDIHADYGPNRAWMEALPSRVSHSQSDPLSVLLVAGDVATGNPKQM
jgi:hypothetical protein